MSEYGRAFVALLDAEDLAELRGRLEGETRWHAVLTTAAAGQRAGVSARTVRRAIDVGLLEAGFAAGRWQMTAEAVDDWRSRGCPTTPKRPPTRSAAVRPRAKAHSTGGSVAILEAGRIDR
jgi:hypothetical protein